MKTCVCCSSSFDNLDVSIQTCSNGCASSLEMTSDLQHFIKKVEPSKDPRIFFYPMSFGRLVDEYTILALKRGFTPSISRQQRLDYLLFKCKRSIETRLGQIAYVERQREGILKLIETLYQTNGTIWKLNDFARNKNLPLSDRTEKYFEIVELQEKRDRAIAQLDILVQGKSEHYRIYNGKDAH